MAMPDPAKPILIADPCAASRRVIRSFLERIGYRRVEDAATSDEALARLRRQRHELVICSWLLEPHTGDELLREIRSTHGLKRLPVLMLTLRAVDERDRAAKLPGVSGVIVKPFGAAALLAALQALRPPRATRQAAPERPPAGRRS